MNVIAQNNQSLLDIAIQATGSAVNWLKIALANDLNPTDKLLPGTEILIPEGLKLNTDVTRYYEVNGISPATALSGEVASALNCLEKLYECFK